MKSSPKRLGFVLLAVLLASGAVLAQSVDIPLNNWTVPPYQSSSARGGITTMSDVTQGLAFVGVAPCRLVDTRTTTIPNFPAGYGPPALTGGVPRNFDLNNDPKCTGLPGDGLIQAYSLNITVTNTQGPGFILIYPQGGSQPPVSTLNYLAGETVANAAIVPAGGAQGGVTVIAGVSGTDLIIDINGYFSEEAGNTTNFFYWQSGNTGTFGAARFNNTDTGSGTRYGLTGVAGSTGDGSAAVVGREDGTSGNVFGGKFSTASTAFDSAGVKGISGNGDPLGESLDCFDCQTAGVRGVDDSSGTETGFGVLALSRSAAVGGLLLDPTDVTTFVDTDAEGYLGFRSGATFYGVLSNGGTGGTGIKSFLEPHAKDASKVIRYVSLEGPEAGTYFRGRAKFQNGLATIDVPEDFRLVTDTEGLSIQVTPIGQMATVAVASIGLERIVVRASRDVEFFYLVNGVRATFKDHKPIVDGIEFMPKKAEARMPRYLSEGQKQLLIQNGTYHPDGTVNMETARRLGWDRIWAERAQKRPQPALVETP